MPFSPTDATQMQRSFECSLLKLERFELCGSCFSLVVFHSQNLVFAGKWLAQQIQCNNSIMRIYKIHENPHNDNYSISESG
jgi:hypothetical protein